MKIYFIRHGETEGNVNKIITGHFETVLTEEGKKQVSETAKQLPATASIIYSSDLGRCKQTTEILNQKLNLPVVYDARLREAFFGELEGKGYLEVGDKMSLEKYRKLDYDYHHLGGESVEDVKERILAFVAEVSKKHAGEDVIAVTSAGIVRLLHYVFNKNIVEIIHNTSMHEFEFKD